MKLTFCYFCVRSSGFENKRKRGKVSGWIWRCPGKVGVFKGKANKMWGRWREEEKGIRRVELLRRQLLLYSRNDSDSCK